MRYKLLFATGVALGVLLLATSVHDGDVIGMLIGASMIIANIWLLTCNIPEV